MRRRLREHQIRAMGYFRKWRHPALFFEMRLGKTLSAIRWINLYSPRPDRILVVAPSSALGSWKDELQKEGELKIVSLVGMPKKKRIQKLTDGLEEGLRWFLLNKEGHLALPQVARIPWDVLILDESTFIKNPTAKKVTKFFLNNFREVPHRWILTGTPNPEGELDLVNQFLFLDGEVMGCRNYWEFRSRYCSSDPMGYRWRMRPKARKRFQEFTRERSLILGRREAGLGETKVHERRMLDLPSRLRSIYRELEEDFILFGLKGKELSSTIWATSRFISLRQLCSGWLQRNLVWKGKIRELLDLLCGELFNEPVVVWFTFNKEIAASAEELGKAGISCAKITGETPLEQREEYRRGFFNGNPRVLLIQQAVAQTGMNLSAADTAIYFSLPTSSMAKRQTEDRIVSVGKKTPLLYLYLLVEDSVEEDLYWGLEDKEFTSNLFLRRFVMDSMLKRRK